VATIENIPHLCTVMKFMTMLKIKVLLLVLVTSATTLRAQQLKVQGTSPSLYLTHTVAAKENWYSIGRLYNVSPKEIAPLNNSSMDKPLAIGQALKIPLTTNLSIDGTKAADEVFVPVYYTVQEKEWLYRISQNHQKVAVANLEKWNNITNDQLKPGMNLIVGYLKVKQGQSALAASGTNKVVAVTAAPPVAKTEPVKEEPKKEEPKKETPVTATAPVSNTGTPPNTTTTPNKETTTGTVKTEEPKTTLPAPVVEKPVTTPPATTPASTTPSPAGNNTAASSNHKGGYFRSQYAESGKTNTGNAGIFRSTSGWKDGKYYALMNNVPVGTIVKITFTSTQKTVYAKVLGQLPEMKESIGLMVRLSDAAASELGTENGKFYVDVKY
jgi:LysM repeat protein